MKEFAALISFCMFAYGFSIPASEFSTKKNCTKERLTPLIVGGKTTKSGSYPWMVSLREKDENGVLQHVCGASIINENWIVTAAHCIFFPKSPWMYKAVVGLNKLSEENAPNVQHIMIAKLFVHEDYDKRSYQNDITLLQTVKPMDFSGSKNKVNRIHLPTTNKDPTGDAKVIGWGHTKEDGENSDTLREVEIPLISREKCNLAYDNDPTDDVDAITENMICAGKNGKDSCQNDSGGPLFQKTSKGVSTLIGVVSFGVGCGERKYPGVYTKVSSYRKWIKKIMMKNDKK